MKKVVLFVHSAGSQGQDEGSDRLVRYLEDALGKEYEVLHPEMPEPENPRYIPWKQQLQKELEKLEGEVILIGHSLGGSVLLKYLSEEKCPVPILGVFLVATAYWGVKDWEIDEFILQPDFSTLLPPIPKLFLYHSKGDEWVPFGHLWHYVVKLPHASVRVLEGDEHEFYDGLPELVEDIKNV